MHKLNPAVNKSWLLILAGLAWSGVGILLCSLAFGWLAHEIGLIPWAAGIGGIAISLLVYRFGFIHIAQKNVARIRAVVARACLFAFMPWKSYLLMIFMMALGIFLRSSALPKPYLAVLYTSIGGGLFLSSLEYYQALLVLIWPPRI
jgi:hypothetical protein